MPSVFTLRPRSGWTAHNAWAFAIRDGFPVTPGHTLVVPIREVATWFEATAEEKLAIVQLIDEVKARLDEELHPDGYNVGFNSGSAAGQTVPHLHVHVIPRFRGDSPDPRGGVRHVIPGRGNYLLEKASPLATGGATDPFLAHIRPLFQQAKRVFIVAAFVQDSGLQLIQEDLAALARRGGHIRLLTGDYLAITQAVALERLLGWEALASDDVEVESRTQLPIGQIETRIVETAKLTPAGISFHPKSWLFEGDAFGTGFVGSSNLSRSALHGGIEWNLRLDRSTSPEAWGRTLAAFEELWALATPLTSEWLSGYESRARSGTLPAEPEEEENAEPAIPIPHEIQRSALDALQLSREQGHERALVVLATGLGKTWLAAFDAEAFAAAHDRFPRVLFVAHRAEILDQAASTFGRIARHMGTTPRVSWFVGSGGDLAGDLVFASVQKLSRRESLRLLQEQAFDYVVVDEVHHATAESYRRVLDHVRARFVLGLTATPDRADDGDVRGLFDDHVSFEAGLGIGVEKGLLCPFQYWGIKDTVDYANIPWRNTRFDMEALAEAAATEARMQSLWEAWGAKAGARSLVFCCSVRHAEFVRDWLRGRGVRCETVSADTTVGDRRSALDALRAGQLDAICAVDLFNEGIDLPGIDRVVMLRPTESSVLFLQQLGRGLRRADGKDRLTVIDFVGNHRVFLERLRLLLSLGRQPISLRDFLEKNTEPELPFGCSVQVELEAVDLLRKLLPVGENQVIRAYRDLKALRGTRPSAGELHRLGYLPSRLQGWFAFVDREGDLGVEEREVFRRAADWLRELETTTMTKSFKMVTLEVLLESDSLTTGLPIHELARRSHAYIARSPELVKDIEGVGRFTDPRHPDWAAWEAYWRENPIKAWSQGPQRRWFRVDGDQFVPTLPFSASDAVAFTAMTRELVDYRLAQYRQRHKTAGPAGSFSCKVTWNKRDPILKLPRSSDGDGRIPHGEADVRVPDGSMWRFHFAKEFCNVARPVGSDRNQLPDLLRTWFGPSAGHPGTNFHVAFRASPDGLWLEPCGVVAPMARHTGIPAYPTLRAAAGAVRRDSWGEDDAEQVSLPVSKEGERLFAVRASGSSMDGGKEPIRDGDWVVLRWARGEALKNLHHSRKVALVETRDPSGDVGYQLKRVVREGGAWLLRSDNPDVGDFEGSENSAPIAVVQEVVRPEDLGPRVGELVPEDSLGGAFGLESTPEEGRVGGHLFFLVQEKGAFVAPDRLKRPIARRPAETAFVLARGTTGEPWRYCGVARWNEEEGLWTLPELDYATWRALGSTRSASRRLADEYLQAATALAERISKQAGDPSGLRVLGRAAEGGLRIDGGPGGFAERTVSLLDLGWVLAAAERAKADRLLLDEALVNRLRYLEGTPKESTRWIDTKHALTLYAVDGSRA